MRMIFVATVLAACQQGPNDGAGSADDGLVRFSVEDGSPEGIGMLGFVNSIGTTSTLLDIDVGLDKRAADAIVAHRNGKDNVPGTTDDNAYETIAELDAQYYVGDTALQLILDYATANGWVTQGDPVIGTFDGVVFTASEAEAVLALVNEAPVAELDVDVGLDSRAATNIVAKRPIDDLYELAAISYVGTSALEALKAYATAWTTDQLVAGLDPAVEGMYYMSESDYPLVVLTIDGAYPVNSSTIQDALGDTSNRSVEVRTLDEQFGRYVTPGSWWTEEDVAIAAQWQAVLDLMNHTKDPQVFRLGNENSDGDLSGAIDIYVLGGSAEGDLVGFSTVSIET